MSIVISVNVTFYAMSFFGFFQFIPQILESFSPFKLLQKKQTKSKSPKSLTLNSEQIVFYFNLPHTATHCNSN